MNNVLEYKGYFGSVEYSVEDHILHGKVLGIRSLISYEGNNLKELMDDFRGAIDDYFIVCEAEGMALEGPYQEEESPYAKAVQKELLKIRQKQVDGCPGYEGSEVVEAIWRVEAEKLSVGRGA